MHHDAESAAGLPETIRIRDANVAERVAEIVERYDLVLSFHCKQRFPAALIDGV
ncbi:hypothetical protein GR254_06530, partial [Mycobacterium tuberculosis]|nr:hypothetical protein [Mycobacterium tuberculosis]